MKSLIVICLSLWTFAPNAHAAERKLNVLFIAVDDLRPELGCYGRTLVQSPNIDAFAKQSLQFNRAYCQLSLCNPSRSSILTGRRVETLGVYDLKTFVRDKNPDVITLPQLFKDHGYRTLSFGKIFHTGNGNHEDPISWSEKSWHPRPAPTTQTKPGEKAANDDPSNEDPHADDLPTGAPDCADNALPDGQVAQKVIEALRANKDQPFFIGAGFYRPHLPFVAPKKYWDQYDPKAIQLAPNPFLPKDAPAFASNDASEIRRYMGVPKTGPLSEDLSRNLIHGYYASVSYVDAQIGKVLAALDELELRDSTVVILWGDHGYQLGEHATWNKRTNWEIATRVPLLISIPGQTTRGKQSDALVELVDMYPTLAELCGITLPEKLEGTSFVPLLTDPAKPWKSAVFTVYEKRIPGLGVGLGRAMRTDRYRLVEWSAAGNPKRIYELYDHQTDPDENINIADLPVNKELVEALSKQLHAAWTGALPAALMRFLLQRLR